MAGMAEALAWLDSTPETKRSAHEFFSANRLRNFELAER